MAKNNRDIITLMHIPTKTRESLHSVEEVLSDGERLKRTQFAEELLNEFRVTPLDS